MRALVAAGAAALLLAGCTSSGHHSTPTPPAPTAHVPLVDGTHIQRLHGMPLPGRLAVEVVDGNKLINLDTHRTKQIAGLPSDPTWVAGYSVATRHVLSVEGRPFVLSDGDMRARPIASNVSWMAPGLDGIWLTRGGKNCTLTEVSATGQTIAPARSVDCRYHIREETPRGLIADTSTGEVLLDKQLRALVRSKLIAIAGKALITTDGRDINVAGHGSTRLPGTIGTLGDLFVSPDNAYVAIEFDNPACPGPRQCLDIRILRLATMQWTHPPSMPVSMYLKPHTLSWGPGDRFNWLGTFDGVGGAIATWQPGATALRIRQISLPESQYAVLGS